ncbi:O-antigen ligase family protein [Cronobacter dublinensis subsp. dublinensis]|nr:O-antigen ligase family protein [Cronobacter dublinensis subsp. dublinensis]EGT5669553.1 O-antigen ligase family protein [Cronobacter dublinensis subsp. dublinensis]EGT5674582.1 O-antigen ligase family protein [Cronobacter dublinensis subsp. dublinensis]EGT5678163.1 O-antigen ligase family protein [Cronobacter dublinensis subsp. dublinensis]EGT5686544.1 O-antigen ligase family protein [Cronobacter dublinensis subsp. dublinensis]
MGKLILGIVLCLSAFYIKNSATAGVALPYNLTFIAWLGLVLMILAWRYKNAELKAQRQPLLTAGSLLLLFPWLLEARDNPGVWVLLAAVVLWQALLRLSFTPRQKRQILLAVFVLALGQALIALLQAFCPHLAMQLYEYDWLRNHGRPYGIFQQVNLLASFLATGVGCGFLLLLTTPRRQAWLLTAGLGVMVFVLALNQSRAGAIGAVVVTAAICAAAGRGNITRAGAALGVMTLCAWAGWYITQHVTVMVNGEPYLMARDYAGSTRERWHILVITWQMIMEKPWLGWGYGTFEYAFSRWALAHPGSGYRYAMPITHPHNELLYMWFQGGVVALAGMLLLVTGWLSMLKNAWRHGREATAFALLVAPLLVHLNLEYPFYQSFVHFGLFILLLRLGVVERTQPARTRARLWPRALCGAVALALIAFSAAGLYANQQLTRLERSGLAGFPAPAPWYFATQFERAKFDAMVALLIDYNRTHNEANLDEFMAQAQRWSLRHNDKNLWQSQIMIAQHRGDVATVARLRTQYARLFPAAQISNAP